jgi:hypothetical protein
MIRSVGKIFRQPEIRYSLLAFLIIVTSCLTYIVKYKISFASAIKSEPRSSRDSKRSNRAHVLAATYYKQSEKLNSTLMLSNQGPHIMPVQITLYNRSGEEFVLPTVTFAAREVKAINLRDYAPVSGFEEGSLQVSYQGKSMELGGVAQLVNEKESLIFDEELSNPKSFASKRLEGNWWLPWNDVEMNLALSNTTSQNVTAMVRIEEGLPGKAIPVDISLGPHETRVFEVARLIGKEVGNLSKAGGISIIHNGPIGGMLARGLVSKSAVGYSDVIEFYDPSKAKTTRIDGVGLRMGRTAGKPLIQGVVARNVEEKRVKLDGRISYVTQNGAGQITLPSIWLDSGEIKVVDVRKELEDNNIQQVLVSGLHFEHTGTPGNVVISATSVSIDGTYVFRVPFRDASLSTSTGIYPWSLEGDSSATVYLQNVSDTPHDYTLRIIYDGGRYVLGIKNLAARQVIAYDIRKLRDQQIPDVLGHTIPRNITSGKFHWSIRGTGDHSLIGRIEQVNTIKGLSMTAACGSCCPDSFSYLFMDPSGVVGFPGGTTQFTAYEQDVDCFGNFLPAFPTSGGLWTSQNQSVATVNQSGFATAVSTGTTIIGFSASRDIIINCCSECGNDEVCCSSQPVDATCEATCDVLCATPTNFRQTGVDDLGNGNLQFHYAWDSSSGNKQDLSDCFVFEIVHYPSTGQTYLWNSPPYVSGFLTRTDEFGEPITGNMGKADDTHGHAGFLSPYREDMFTATQKYQYTCPCKENGKQQDLVTGLQIIRQVKNGPPWRYTVTKSGSSASTNLP